MPSGTQGQLLPAWDLNGQMCVLPDGRFVGGYDPTLPSQHNLGSAKPYKQPADGEELDDPNGSFSGQTLYVPGPYKMPRPDHRQRLAADRQRRVQQQPDLHRVRHRQGRQRLRQRHRHRPGRLPAAEQRAAGGVVRTQLHDVLHRLRPHLGGYGPHHTDGTGGLAQPGMMALADNGDVLVPNVGTSSVLRFAASSLPTSAADCPGGVYPRSKVHVSTFVKVPFAAGIAKDPTCDCFAVSSYIGDPSIRLGDRRAASPSRGGARCPGPRSPTSARAPGQYNPFGMAFAPDGTLYFIDIHVACKGLLTGCGPAAYGGRVMKVTFTNGQPVGAGHGGERLRLPDQRDGVRAGHDACPYPDRGRSSRRCRARPRTRRRPRARLGQARHRRLRLSVVVRRRRLGAAARPRDSGTATARHRSRRWRVGAGARSSRGAAPGWCRDTVPARRSARRHGATAPPSRRHPAPVGLAHLRPRRPAHLPRPHHADQDHGQDAAQGVVLPHRRRRHRHADGGRRHRLRRLVGRLLLRRRTSRPGRCGGRSGSSPRTPSRPIRARAPRPRPPTAGSSPPRRGSSRQAATRPALVIFGGGYTLYALDAATGAVYWEHDYPGARAAPTPTPTAPASSRRRWSPTGVVLFGVDVDGQPGSGGYIVAASLADRRPGVGVPDRRGAHRRQRARRRLRQRVVVGHRACPPWGWSCSAPPTAISPTRALCRVRASPCTSATARWPGSTIRSTHAPAVRLGLRGHRQRRGVRRRDDDRSSARAARTAPTTRSTRATGRCAGRPTSSSAGSRAGSSPPPPTTATRVYGATAIGDFGRFEARACKPVCDPIQPPRHGVAEADRPRLRRRDRDGGVAGGRCRLVRAHHGGGRHDLQRPGAVAKPHRRARRRHREPHRRRSSCPRPTGPASPRWATPWCSGWGPPPTPRIPGSRC